MLRPRWPILALASLLFLCPALCSSVAADDSTAIAHLAAGFHAEHRFSGSVLVGRGDEVIYEGGFGEADRAWHIPNRPDTVFLVGSISKQFTSMLILQLAAEGKLSLTDTLAKFYPDYPEDKAGITLHQLLCHHSGLPHYAGFSQIDIDLGDYLRLYRSVADYVKLIGKLELHSEPGTRHAYSSMGYIILAHIAEEVTGKTYSQLLEERIAKPIGVEDLGFAYDDRLVERLAHGYVFDIRRRDDGKLELGYAPEPYRDQSNKYSTGGVHASARALFRWARAAAKNELLDGAYAKKMWTPQAETYGYGWEIESGESIGLPADVEVISHGGSLSGYRASIVLLDRGRYTLIALGNSNVSRSGALTGAIARLLHGAEPGHGNILGTAVAWRMVRDGVDVASNFFRQQHEAGVPDYFNNDFAFYAYAEDFAGLERPDLGLAIVDLGLAAHPESALLQLGAALNQQARGDRDAARVAAQRARELASEGNTPSWVPERAQALLEELAAKPAAVGE